MALRDWWSSRFGVKLGSIAKGLAAIGLHEVINRSSLKFTVHSVNFLIDILFIIFLWTLYFASAKNSVRIKIIGKKNRKRSVFIIVLLRCASVVEKSNKVDGMTRVSGAETSRGRETEESALALYMAHPESRWRWMRWKTRRARLPRPPPHPGHPTLVIQIRLCHPWTVCWN